MDYVVFASDEYTVTVSRTLWQILWRVECRIKRFYSSRVLPKELSGTVRRELRASKELSPGTRDAVHAFARKAIIEPYRERERAIAEAAEERRSQESIEDAPLAAQWLVILAWGYLPVGLVVTLVMAIVLAVSEECSLRLGQFVVCDERVDWTVFTGVTVGGMLGTGIVTALLLAVSRALILLQEIADSLAED